MLTPYQYASNSPIAGSDLDGLEFKLEIYSPMLSSRFKEAVNAEDIYHQRAITLFGRSHHFKSGFGLASIGRTQYSPAAQLYYHEDYPDGVSVVLYDWKNHAGSKNSNGEIVAYEWMHFPKNSNIMMPEGVNYPTDVNWETDFYGKYDFKEFNSGGFDGGMLYGVGTADSQGFINGWGFFTSVTKMEMGMLGVGGGYDVNMFNRGRYIGYDNFPTLDNFAGKGKFGGFDFDIGPISFSAQLWRGVGLGPAGFAWKGFNFAVGSGIGAKVVEGGNTFTTILFPKSTTGYSITPEEWTTNRLEPDKIQPIIYEDNAKFD